MSDATDELAGLQAKWSARLDGVQSLDERMMYVTRDEWLEIRRMEQLRVATEPIEVTRARELRKAVYGSRDLIDVLLGSPVVIDDGEAAQQLSRLGDDRGHANA